jgi:hypothetical protein
MGVKWKLIPVSILLGTILGYCLLYINSLIFEQLIWLLAMLSWSAFTAWFLDKLWFWNGVVGAFFMLFTETSLKIFNVPIYLSCHKELAQMFKAMPSSFPKWLGIIALEASKGLILCLLSGVFAAVAAAILLEWKKRSVQ